MIVVEPSEPVYVIFQGDFPDNATLILVAVPLHVVGVPPMTAVGRGLTVTKGFPVTIKFPNKSTVEIFELQ